VTVRSLHSDEPLVKVGRATSSRLKVGVRRTLVSTAGSVAMLVILSDKMQTQRVEANRTEFALRSRSRICD
jgi:hypothetical protein